MKIQFEPQQFRTVKINPQESRVILSRQFGKYTGATQVSSARLRMNAEQVTHEVVNQIHKEFDKAFGAQATIDSEKAEELLFNIDLRTWIKIG